MGFDSRVVNQTCSNLWPLSCMQWPGVNLRDLREDTDPRYMAVRRAGLIAPPAHKKLGNVGLALAHITAWQYVASAQERSDAPRLIMEEDERVRHPEHVRELLGMSSLAFDIFYMNALRPSGVHRGSDPRHVLRVQPFDSLDRRSGRLETNVWMGAYALRPSGAARLLEALRATQPDVSSIVLDVWVARRVVDPRAGLSVCVWDQTNHLFRHGDERISMRKDQNGGIERYLDRAVRTMRGGDDKGHPIILPTGLRVDVSEVVGPLATPRSSCVRIEACFLTLGFLRCSQLEGFSRLALDCFTTPDGHARLLLVVTDVPIVPLVFGCLAALALCLVLAACRCRRRRGRAGRDTPSPPTAHASVAFTPPSGKALGGKGHQRTPSTTFLLANDDDDDDDD